MSIEEFAEKHRLKLKKDGCGDSIIPGRLADRESAETVKRRAGRGVKRVLAECHSHLYDGFTDGKLGVYLSFSSPKRYGNARRALLVVGCEGKQAADSVRPGGEYPTDGCLKFDPANDAQAELVVRLAGLKKRRVLSDEARQAASDRMRARFNSTRPHEERPLAA